MSRVVFGRPGLHYDQQAYLASVARRGDLQRLRKQGFPWDGRACESAAAHGHLALLQWAVAEACPRDPAARASRAATSGHQEVVSWIEWAASPEVRKEPDGV